MADHNSLARGIRAHEIDEDDPLEELARIVAGNRGRTAAAPRRQAAPAPRQDSGPGYGARGSDESDPDADLEALIGAAAQEAAAGAPNPAAPRFSAPRASERYADLPLAERYEMYRQQREAERSPAPAEPVAAGSAPRQSYRDPSAESIFDLESQLMQELDSSMGDIGDDMFDLSASSDDPSAELLEKLAAMSEPAEQAGDAVEDRAAAETFEPAESEVQYGFAPEPAQAPNLVPDAFDETALEDQLMAELGFGSIAGGAEEIAPEASIPEASTPEASIPGEPTPDETAAEAWAHEASTSEASTPVAWAPEASTNEVSPEASPLEDSTFEASDFERELEAAFDQAAAGVRSSAGHRSGGADDEAFRALITAELDDSRDPFAPPPRGGRERIEAPFSKAAVSTAAVMKAGVMKAAAVPAPEAAESYDPFDLASEFERSFEAELEAGRTTSRFDGHSRAQEAAENRQAPSRSPQDLARSLEQDLAALEATIAGHPAEQPAIPRANYQLPQGSSHVGAASPAPAARAVPGPAAAPASSPAAPEDFDIAVALEAELSDFPNGRTAGSPVSRPAFASERGLEDHFASAFAAELEVIAKPAVAPAAAPVSAVKPPVAPPPQYGEAAPPAGVDDEDEAAHAVAPGPHASRNGFRLAAYALGAALVLGLGAVSYGYFRGGLQSADTPVVVKADDAPIKIKPEDPGGTAVANQDQAAYQRVAGKFEEDTRQEKLVSATEEPVTLPGVEPAEASAAPELESDPLDEGAGIEGAGIEGAGIDGAEVEASDLADSARKAEERLEPGQQRQVPVASIATLEPRRVRTLVVKPDGTIVAPPAAEGLQPPVPAAATSETAFAPAEEAAPAVDGARSTGEIPVPEPRPQFTPAVERSGSTGSVARVQPVVETVRSAETPALASPAEIPAETPVVTPVATSEWMVQVAARTSQEAAQASYSQIAGKFPDVLDGRQMVIVQGEVEGKGTVFRARVLAESKTDATDLCTRLKAAGGNCFVTR